jgi:hypothetical protein
MFVKIPWKKKGIFFRILEVQPETQAIIARLELVNLYIWEGARAPARLPSFIATCVHRAVSHLSQTAFAVLHTTQLPDLAQGTHAPRSAR